MNNDKTSLEIRIYRLVKNDLEYIIKDVGKYGLDALKLYIECVDKKIKSLEEEGRQWIMKKN